MSAQSEQLLRAIGEVDQELVLDAAPLDVLPQKRAVWLKWSGLAACVCIVAAAAFAFGTAEQPGTGGLTVGPEETSPTVTAEPPTLSLPEVVRISMDGIVVNEMSDLLFSSSARLYDPALFEHVRWGAEDVARYYGRTLAPSYVPDGLTPTNEDGSASVVIRREDGAVVEDTVCLGYYQLFGTWEDGSPRFIDENCVEHGFGITVSRLGRMDDCVYLYDEMQRSDVAGVPVTIGHCSMPYGPFDPDTHVPAGYYDLYVAEFTLDGIQFQVTASELELDEVVKVTASIICPESEIVLDP